MSSPLLPPDRGGDAACRAALDDTLRHVRFELVPMRGATRELAFLPPNATVTVTASPAKGPQATIDLAAAAAAERHHVVAHLAARSIIDPVHLRDVLAQLADHDVVDLFVVAGDAPNPAGEFTDALGLLRTLAELDHGGEVGITGYPESHAFIDDQATIEAMNAKAPHADYIVSQICYDAAVTGAWVRALRARNVMLPVHLGLPGVVNRTRLFALSLKVGLGDSLRFLAHQPDVSGRLLAGYAPDDLVAGLGPTATDPTLGVAGWHLFTFNEVAATVAWWRSQLVEAQPRRTTTHRAQAPPPVTTEPPAHRQARSSGSGPPSDKRRPT